MLPQFDLGRAATAIFHTAVISRDLYSRVFALYIHRENSGLLRFTAISNRNRLNLRCVWGTDVKGWKTDVAPAAPSDQCLKASRSTQSITLIVSVSLLRTIIGRRMPRLHQLSVSYSLAPLLSGVARHTKNGLNDRELWTKRVLQLRRTVCLLAGGVPTRMRKDQGLL